ncbi:MAG TPA: hypothetical protein VHQ03_08930 [Candidatus Dormibacteraeota bacterium]|nr:hypothetical protein [Candidatus Dormibacteraeota bacterium]
MESSINPWAVFLLVLAGLGMLGGFALARLPQGGWRSTTLSMLIVIAALAIVGSVGWGYAETRRWERLSDVTKKTDRQRILSYLAAGIFTVALAITGAMVPVQLGRILWAIYIPVGLVGGLIVGWIRKRLKRPSHHRRVRP